jgi:hypothetical protein
MGKGYGDKLASGSVKATFPTTEHRMTDEEWQAMFQPEKPEEKPKQE